MNLEKKYHDMEGKERNILEMVRLYPEWAANMIQMKEGWKSGEEATHKQWLPSASDLELDDFNKDYEG